MRFFEMPAAVAMSSIETSSNGRALNSVSPTCRSSALETAQQVAAVLWADDVAADLGVRLEVLAGDMPSAEILDFAGLQAPVYSAFSVLPSPGRSASSARRARMRARRA